MTNVLALPVANRLKQLIDELNTEFALVSMGSQIRALWEHKDPVSGRIEAKFLKIADFKVLTKNRPTGDPDTPSVAEFFLKHPERRQYYRVDFIPGSTPDGVYNLWRGYAVKAIAGCCDRFWRFVLEVICAGDMVAYRFVRKWLAHLIQRPAELPGTALVLVGKQGIGKGTFVGAIGALVGPHYMVLNSLEQLTGRFTGHLADKLLVHADEAIWGGNKSAEGALKAMITDPLLPLEAKGQDIVSVHNYKRLIASSNETWAVPRGLDDRRFYVLEVSESHKEDQAYFAAIREELWHGGLEALMYDLQHEDLNDFNPRVMPPTGAGLVMKLKSASSAVRWLYEYLEDGYEPQQLYRIDRLPKIDQNGGAIEKDRLYEQYRMFCTAVDHTRPEPNSQFFKTLRAIIPTVREVRMMGFDGLRVRHLIFPSLQVARECFETHLKQKGTIVWAEATTVEPAKVTAKAKKAIAGSVA